MQPDDPLAPQRDSAGLLYDILDHAPAAILLVSLPEFRILAINARACARFGIRVSATLVGRRCAEVIPHFTEEGIGALWLSVAGITPDEDHAESATQVGGQAVRRWNVHPVRDPGGAVTRLLIMRFESGETPEQQLASSTRQITHALISTLERDQLLDLILVQLHNVVAYDSATIMLRDEDGYYVAAGRGLVDRDERARWRFDDGEPLLRQVEAAHEPIIIRDTAEAGTLQAPFGATRGWVGVPLRAQGEVVGVLTLESQTPHRYTRADAARAQSFAAYAALAVRNAEIYRQAREQSRRLALVGKIARDITATHDLRTIFGLLIDHLRDAVSLSFAELALIDAQHRLELVARYPESIAGPPGHEWYGDDDLRDLLAALDDGWPRTFQLTGAGCGALLQARLAQHGARSCVVVPIVADQSSLGILVLASQQARAFPTIEVATLADLAQHLAVAIQNARLHQAREQALADLRIAQQRLIQSERLTAVGELVAGVAHELNNPLTAVLGFASILQQTAPAELQEDLAPIVEGATRARRIVQNLLTFARQREAHLEEVDLNMTVRQVLSLLAYQMRTGGITVEERLTPGLPTTVADATAIKQVLLNLLNNAQQALVGWDGVRHITVSTTMAGGGHEQRLVLEVADTGPGIAPEHLALVFEPFFTTKPIGEGTGLGLSICYGIVKQYDGDIRVQSRPGEGTCFSVELPVRTLDAHPMEEPLPPDGPTPMRRILVIDDEPIVTALLARLLGEQGFDVDVCHDSLLAFDYIGRTEYDLIISDIRMPAMSGEQLYEELLRRAPQLAHRLLFISGDTASRGTREFLDQTGVMCVEKPFETAELLAAIRLSLSGAA